MSFVKFDSLEEKEPVPGYKAVFVHSKNMTLAYWDIEEGAVMPEHSHPHEQIASVVEGQFELTIAGESRVVGIDSAAVIPPNTPHSGKAVTHCRIIDAFHPVREDYTQRGSLTAHYKPDVAVIKQAVLEGGSLPLEHGLQMEQGAFLTLLGMQPVKRAL